MAGTIAPVPGSAAHRSRRTCAHVPSSGRSAANHGWSATKVGPDHRRPSHRTRRRVPPASHRSFDTAAAARPSSDRPLAAPCDAATRCRARQTGIRRCGPSVTRVWARTVPLRDASDTGRAGWPATAPGRGRRRSARATPCPGRGHRQARPRGGWRRRHPAPAIRCRRPRSTAGHSQSRPSGPALPRSARRLSPGCTSDEPAHWPDRSAAIRRGHCSRHCRHDARPRQMLRPETSTDRPPASPRLSRVPRPNTRYRPKSCRPRNHPDDAKRMPAAVVPTW